MQNKADYSATSIAAGKDINLQSQGDINVKGSTLQSQNGKIELVGTGDINSTNETEQHESLHKERTGFLSKTKTDI